MGLFPAFFIGLTMKLEIGDILERVGRTEGEMEQYRQIADVWESMWRLQVFKRTPKQAIEQDGQEQVTLPTPFNIVNLAQRLFSTTPKIDVPPLQATKEADDGAAKCEQWLQAMWQAVNRQQRRNIIADATWWTMVRGRNVFEVKWVEDDLPEKLRKKRLPILVRTLDPLNVGIKHGPLFVQWAYHKYTDDRLNVQSRYPKLKLLKNSVANDHESTCRYEVIVNYCWIISNPCFRHIYSINSSSTTVVLTVSGSNSEKPPRSWDAVFLNSSSCATAMFLSLKALRHSICLLLLKSLIMPLATITYIFILPLASTNYGLSPIWICVPYDCLSALLHAVLADHLVLSIEEARKYLLDGGVDRVTAEIQAFAASAGEGKGAIKGASDPVVAGMMGRYLLEYELPHPELSAVELGAFIAENGWNLGVSDLIDPGLIVLK
jgi:hypothetical protein